MKTSDKILELLKTGKYQAEIAKELNLTDATVSYHVKRLEKANIIKSKRTSVKNFEVLSKLDSNFTYTDNWVNKKQSSSSTDEDKNVRIHGLALEYTLVDKLEATSIQAKLDQAKLAYPATSRGLYFFKLGGFMLRLTKNSLTIWCKEKTAPRNSNVKALEAKAIEEAELVSGVAKNMLELNTEPYHKIMEHIAYVNDEGAEEAHNTQQKIEIRDPIDKQARFIVDFSNRKAEAEFVHTKHSLPDADKYARMVDDVTRLDGWNRTQSLLQDTAILLQRYAYNVDLHVKVLQKLDRKLSQRKLEI